MAEMTEAQKQFIWLCYGMARTYNQIEAEIKVSRTEYAKWDKEFKSVWEPIAAIRRIYMKKKVTGGFKSFYDWYLLQEEKEKKCCYCKITNKEIEILVNQKLVDIKKAKGKNNSKFKPLEIQRKSNTIYKNDITNIDYMCYWCHASKMDTFTNDEFIKIGAQIEEIWKKRLSKVKVK